MRDLSGKTIAILATHGFEKSELFEPLRRLREAGAVVQVVSPEHGRIRSWQNGNWDEEVEVDRPLEEVTVADFDGLVIPGGQINPDLLRVDEAAVGFVRAFFDSGKPLAAICHGPWLLIEADAVRGLRTTSYHSIQTDMKNAGAQWVDQPVVVDQGLITSRQPDDLEDFCTKIAEQVANGRYTRRSAA